MPAKGQNILQVEYIKASVVKNLYEKLKESFNLKTDQREKLIELLLLIGTLSAAFNFKDDWTWLYMFFALSSIIYFISIQNENQFNFRFISFVSAFVSVFFSGIVAGNLFISIEDIPKPNNDC